MPPMSPAKQARLHSWKLRSAALAVFAPFLAQTAALAESPTPKLRSPIALASPGKAQLDSATCDAASPKIKLQGKAEVSQKPLHQFQRVAGVSVLQARRSRTAVQQRAARRCSIQAGG